jgi:PDZ domain-containing protein
MTQRTLAGLVAVPLLLALWVAAGVEGLPYVTYAPGLTVNVLGDNGKGQPIITVDGHKTYTGTGQLRMTTVYVSQPQARNNIFELMHDWISRDNAVYPYAAIYQEHETVEQSKKQGQQEMTSSQDAATAAALTELGYSVTEAEIAAVEKGSPAAGHLEKGDVVLDVGRTAVADGDELVAAVKATPTGRPLDLTVKRDGKQVAVRVTPTEVDGQPHIGVQVGTSTTRFPFEVKVGIDPSIGGPSAGLMFSLGIYDTLTPGSLTGGQVIAGTGTIDAGGTVGPIGGIQQKIAASRKAGARIFLVPPDNCDEAIHGRNGSMRLVEAPTMHSAVQSIQAWVKDHDAKLPTCKGQS